MKVALVTSIPRGGPLEHALVLAAELARRGVEVRAAAADERAAARFAAAGAHAAVLALRPGLDARRAVALWRWARGADVIHSHDRRSGLWARLGPRSRRGGVRVHTVHGLPDPYLPGAGGPGVRDRLAYEGVERALSRRADVLIAPSRAAARLLSERLGYDARRLAVVPNGVVLPSSPLPRGDLVGTMSVLEPVKGLDVFVRAAYLVGARRPGTRFAVFGEGPLEGELRALAARLGVDVAFPGHVPAREALRRLAVLAVPSRMETSGLALLEAMAAGVPAVATTVGGLPETAAGAVPLVPPDDPERLASALLAVLDDPAVAARQADAGRSAARAQGAAAMAERLLVIYADALSARR